MSSFPFHTKASMTEPQRKPSANDGGEQNQMEIDDERTDCSSPLPQDKFVDPDDTNGRWKVIAPCQVFLEPLEKSAFENDHQKEACTRFVLMSDTHGRHRDICPPPGDVLIHAGDMTKMGEKGTIEDLNRYFRESRSTFQDVICIAGNHDITFHTDFYLQNWKHFPFRNKTQKPFDEVEIQQSLKDCTYLQDSSFRTTKGNLEVYGSPWSPTFGLWAFGQDRGDPTHRIWAKIPSSTDVLITHGPPLGRGDMTFHNGRVGCYDLLREVQDRVKPRLHVFGHIHEDYGCTYDGHTLYVNAASVDLSYQPSQFCTVVDLPHDPSQPARVVEPHCTLSSDQFVPWITAHGYQRLVSYATNGADLSLLPVGNDFFLPSAREKVCSALGLYRDAEARKEWRKAVVQLHSESFGPK